MVVPQAADGGSHRLLMVVPQVADGGSTGC